MATVNGVIAAVIATPSSPSTWKTAGYINAREKLSMDWYVALGTEAAGTIIKVGQALPAGAMIIAMVIQTSASTSALTVSVGDGLSATRYASANTGPATSGASTIIGLLDATNGYYIIGTAAATTAVPSGDTQIQLTTGGATLAAGTIVMTRIIFVTD